jgi:hypothetical protein
MNQSPSVVVGSPKAINSQSLYPSTDVAVMPLPNHRLANHRLAMVSRHDTTSPCISSAPTTTSPPAMQIPNGSMPLPRRFRRFILRHLIDDPAVDSNDPIFNNVIADPEDSKYNAHAIRQLLSKNYFKWADIDKASNPVLYYPELKSETVAMEYGSSCVGVSNTKCDFTQLNDSSYTIRHERSPSPMKVNYDTNRQNKRQCHSGSDTCLRNKQYNENELWHHPSPLPLPLPLPSPNNSNFIHSNNVRSESSSYIPPVSQSLLPIPPNYLPTPLQSSESTTKVEQFTKFTNSFTVNKPDKKDVENRTESKIPSFKQNQSDEETGGGGGGNSKQDTRITNKPSNNKSIIQTYGEVFPTGNGWVNSKNENLKLSRVLLQKFSQVEIGKISCETEDSSCNVCKQALSNYWEYVSHIVEHNNAISDYHFKHVHFCPVDICPMSLIGFTKKRDLRHHIHNYHYYRSNILEKFRPWESLMKELSYNCIWPGCSSSFCRKDVLTRHIKLNHQKNTDVKQGECYNCHTNKTSLWYKDLDCQTICNACYQFQRKYGTSRPSVDRRLTATEGKKLIKDRVPKWKINNPI